MHVTLAQLPPALREQAERKIAADKRRGSDTPKWKRRGQYAPSTPVGRLMWHMTAEGLQMPVREHRFHPERKWRFDMAWLDELMVAVEVEGVTHEGGRHQRVVGFGEDCRKYNAAQLMGWTVLRFTQDMIKRGVAIQTLQGVIPKSITGDTMSTSTKSGT